MRGRILLIKGEVGYSGLDSIAYVRTSRCVDSRIKA